jgi:hypothetical protein
VQNQGLPRTAPPGAATKAETEAKSTSSEETTIMRIVAIAIVGVCSGVLLGPSHMAVAQQPVASTSSGNSSGVSDSRAVIRWPVSGEKEDFLCVVTETKVGVASDSLPTRTLRIYRQTASTSKEIFSYETPDSILNVYPLGDYNGRLFLTWVGGSAYHFQVLAFLEGQVRQILYEGSKLPPEFLYDEDGSESVLVTEPSIAKGKWTARNGTTTVFKWNGKIYDKLGVVPWSNRLQCLTKDSCSRLR